jgi:hypothetical protein
MRVVIDDSHFPYRLQQCKVAKGKRPMSLAECWVSFPHISQKEVAEILND